MTLPITPAGAQRLFDALSVIVLTAPIRQWLEANDPQALRQACEALHLATSEEKPK